MNLHERKAHGHLKPARLPIPPQPQNGEHATAWGSGLQADVLEQRCHVRTAVEADQARRPARVEPEAQADPLEEAEDVLGQVAEVVAEVLVRAGPVDEGASVRSDASTKERPRGSVNELLLPGVEHYLPLVLLAASVLAGTGT